MEARSSYPNWPSTRSDESRSVITPAASDAPFTVTVDRSASIVPTLTSPCPKDNRPSVTPMWPSLRTDSDTNCTDAPVAWIAPV